MNIGSCVLKSVLGLVNLLYIILGIAFILLAALLTRGAPKYYTVYMYIIGSMMLLTAIIGYIGICRDHFYLTMTYAFIIFCLLMAQIYDRFHKFNAISVRKFIYDDIHDKWLNELKEPGAMNATQESDHCCGFNGPSDYLSISRPGIPLSCYPNLVANTAKLYQIGCLKAAEDKYVQIFNISVSGSIGGLVFTSIIFLLAIFMVLNFRRMKKYD